MPSIAPNSSSNIWSSSRPDRHRSRPCPLGSSTARAGMIPCEGELRTKNQKTHRHQTRYPITTTVRDGSPTTIVPSDPHQEAIVPQPGQGSTIKDRFWIATQVPHVTFAPAYPITPRSGPDSAERRQRLVSLWSPNPPCHRTQINAFTGFVDKSVDRLPIATAIYRLDKTL